MPAQKSGAQKRKEAAERRRQLAQAGLTPEQVRMAAGLRARSSAQPPPSAEALDPPPDPPPMAAGVAACESWCARLAAQAAADPTLAEDTARALRKAIQSAGKLKDKALRSEKAIKLLQLREGVVLDPTATAPPGRVEALPAWAFLRAVWSCYRCALGDLAAAGVALDLVAAVGFVPCNQAIRALTTRLKNPTAPG